MTGPSTNARAGFLKFRGRIERIKRALAPPALTASQGRASHQGALA